MRRITNAIDDGDDIILEITEEIVDRATKFCTGIGFYKSTDERDIIKIHKKEHITVSKEMIQEIINTSLEVHERCWYKGILLETCNDIYPNIYKDTIVDVLDSPVKGMCNIKYGDLFTSVQKRMIRRIDG